MNTTVSNTPSAIYLSRLELEGFRTYGEKTDITLPAGPSLTVIVGSNGLGKSTLFDSIEWGITGALKRIDNIDATKKEKKQSIGAKPKVKLIFNDGTKILRDGYSKDVNFNDELSPQSTIDKWLIANKAWGGLNSIADCLHLTHFLGQSTKQLFVHLDGRERWNRLEGPSKLQTLWAMEQTLGRKQTTIGFDDLDTKFNQLISQTQQELQLFTKIIDDLHLQQEMARTGAAMSPEEIKAGLDEIQELLQQYFEPENLQSPFKAGEITLVFQKILMEQIEVYIVRKKLQLDEWPTLAETFVDYGVDHAAQVTALNVVKERAQQAAALVRAAQENEKRLRQERDEMQTKIDAIYEEIAKLDQASSHRNQIARISAENIQVNTVLDDLSRSLGEINQIISQKNADVIVLKEQRRKYDILHAHRRDLEETQTNVVALQGLQIRHRMMLSEVNQLAEREPELNREHSANKSALIGIEQELHRLGLQWQQAKATADAMTAALVQIAGTLRDEDCACPLCQSRFPEGKLKEIATLSATLANGQLSQIEVARQGVVLKKSELQQSSQRIVQQLRSLTEGRTAVEHVKEQVQALENGLRRKPMLAVVDVDMFAQTCAARLAELATKIVAAEAEIAQAQDLTALEGLIASLEAERRSILQNKIDQTQKIGEAILRSKQLQQLLSAFSEPELAGLNERLTLLRLDGERAKAILIEKNNALDKLSAITTGHKESHATFVADMAKCDANLGKIDKLQKALQQRWRNLNYSGDPTPERIAEACSDQAQQLVKLKELQLRHERLFEGQRRYSAHTSVQRLEGEKKQILDKFPSKDEAEIKNILSERIRRTTEKQEKLKKVKVKRDQLVNAMKESNEKIRENIAIPLNKSVARFCCALMSDRDFNINVDAVANSATAQALLSFQLDKNEESKKNPLLYLSEGQLAGVGLCLLFGASTIYPWSRWKALLLDDPLHHNDTIHASAFIDVIRNLIMHKGYQIVVSTHDMEQAGYFLRKCANAGIETQYLHLYGRSKNGVLIHDKLAKSFAL